MTVGELMEKLVQLDPRLPVYVRGFVDAAYREPAESADVERLVVRGDDRVVGAFMVTDPRGVFDAVVIDS